MPEKTKGDYTKSIIADIQDYDKVDPESFPELYKHIFDENMFKKGIQEICVKRDYDVDVNNLVLLEDYLTDLAVKKGVIVDSERNSWRNNLDNWFSKAVPDDNENSRKNTYKLCFCLSMNIEEVKHFFYYRYFCRPFNLRMLYELVYYYTLKSEKDYEYAEYLTKILEEKGLLEDKKYADDCYSTNSFMGDLDAIDSEEAFVNFCVENKGYFMRNSQTVVKSINELRERCRIENKEGKKKNINTLVPFAADLCGLDFYKMDRENLPRVIKRALADDDGIYRIAKDKRKVSTEYSRNTIVFLTFYQFFKSLENHEREQYETKDLNVRREIYDQFEIEVNDNLEKCGFSQLYVRNPFDLVFMKSAYQDNAINYFRKAIGSFE